jgi:hypothetical protein
LGVIAAPSPSACNACTAAASERAAVAVQVTAQHQAALLLPLLLTPTHSKLQFGQHCTDHVHQILGRVFYCALVPQALCMYSSCWQQLQVLALVLLLLQLQLVSQPVLLQ